MNDLAISRRAQFSPASPIRKLVPLAEKAKAKGIKIYHLNIGQPDFKLPLKIQHEIRKLKNFTYLPYANSLGITENIIAWQKYYQQIGVSLKTREIIVTSGGSEALILTIAALCDPGEEIIVFEPFYANYAGFASLLSVAVVPVALDPNRGYHLPSISKIKSAINKKTKAILITNPNNPTGTVFTKEELLTILRLAEKHNLFIIADEAYRGICFANHRSYSILELSNKQNRQRIIVVDSLSKRLNVCGARVGAIVCQNEQVLTAVNKFCQARLSAPTIEQIIVSPMLTDSLTYIKKLAGQYKKRRDVFIKTLEKELDITIHRPEGAFYTMVKLPINDTDQFAAWLLTDFAVNKETVMVAPGSGFYANQKKGKNEIRVAFVLKEKDLKKAATILAKAVKTYLSLKSSPIFEEKKDNTD